MRFESFTERIGGPARRRRGHRINFHSVTASGNSKAVIEYARQEMANDEHANAR